MWENAPHYFTQKSPLRPAFSGYFPRLNPSELKSRIQRMEPHLATFLTPPNILLQREMFGDEWWGSYLMWSQQRRQEVLGEVLRSVGFSSKVVDAIASVPRESFVSPAYLKLCYLNWSIPLFKGSALSAPGIVAHYLEDSLRLDPAAVKKVLEVGVGSGYHMLALSYLHPEAGYIGYEPIVDLAEQCSATLKRHGVAAQIIPEAMSQSRLGEHRFDYIYQTVASPVDARRRITSHLNIDGIATLVRPVSIAEFHTEPVDIYLHGKYHEYSEYKVDGWNRRCVVSTIRPSDHFQGEFETLRDLHCVTFVPWKDMPIKHADAGRNSGLEDLLSRGLT